MAALGAASRPKYGLVPALGAKSLAKVPSTMPIGAESEKLVAWLTTDVQMDRDGPAIKSA